MRLANKVAIVTGGGLGIGRATAVRFASEGAKVVVTDIAEEFAAETVRLIVAAGGDAFYMIGNVASVEDNQRVAAETLGRYGQIDILINNAGLPAGYSEGTADEIWNLGIEQTLSSVFRMSSAILPHMIARKSGSIVNICSVAARMGAPMTWYSAAKAGVGGVTRSLAVKHGPDGIRVNSLCLGTIETRRVQLIYDNEALYKRLIERIPLRRFAKPEEVAGAALFMASDDASYLTGDMMTLDGGMMVSNS